MQKNRMMIHHSVGFDPDHQLYNKTSRNFRVAAAELQNINTAPAEIDRVIRECFVKSAPVYIFVPIDMVNEHVPLSALDNPIDLTMPRTATTEQSISAAIEAVASAIYASKNPAVLVDCLVQRHNSTAETKLLVDKLKIPVYSTNMGKGIVDETEPNYVGVYNGTISTPGLSIAIEASDLVLVLGSLPCDTNTGGFSRKIRPENAIEITPTTVTIHGKKIFEDCYIRPFLAKLATSLIPEKVPKVTKPILPPTAEMDVETDAITQSWIWHRIASFLRPHDVVFGETGTAAFGLPDATFPEDVTWITQTYYGSIGYATPAALGADLALAELHAENGSPRGRTVLITGDGSIQLTIQELGTMIARNARPIIFVINNAGYTIERAIHGADKPYNDVAPYNWQAALRLFGMSEEQTKECFHRVATKQEFEEAVAKGSVTDPERVQMVEVVMDRLDCPWRLLSQIATRGEAVVKEMERAGFKVRRPVLKN
ncbi:hypothetical protein LTR66_001581 [Elasticomyces elasticus]|nr:hypothetical protein LTR66_001581 [Elasticomyces elasticus]